MTKLWAWLKAHVRMLKMEQSKQVDSKGAAMGFRWWF